MGLRDEVEELRDVIRPRHIDNITGIIGNRERQATGRVQGETPRQRAWQDAQDACRGWNGSRGRGRRGDWPYNDYRVLSEGDIPDH